MLKSICISVLICLSLLFSTVLHAQDEACLECHGDNSLTTERDGQEISLYVNGEAFQHSIHGENGCVSCHLDADVEELPHDEDLETVDCTMCHDYKIEAYQTGIHGQAQEDGSVAATCADCHGKHDILPSSDLDSRVNPMQVAASCGRCHGKAAGEFANGLHGQLLQKGAEVAPNCTSCHGDHDILPASDPASTVYHLKLASVCSDCHKEASEKYANSLHGQALQHGKFLAPDCSSCHGSHTILSSKNEKSQTYVMNIPALCGSCHKEGTQVSQLRTVSERHVLEDYAESIHGDGLFKRGLIVTAVCTSCHTSHDILPHENPASSINRRNIAGTCLQCHTQIEKVHQKVIRGELWEKKPHQLPICVDCHQPHKVRRVFYEESFPDSKCLSCHSNKNLSKTENGQTISLFVDADHLRNSVHAQNSCIKCHPNVSITKDPVCLDSGPVDCSMCHAQQVLDYQISVHGSHYAQGDSIAPYCTDCHGTHDTPSKDDITSPTFAKNVPDLCGRCHREGQKAAVAYKGEEHEIIKNYTMSIHGKGLLESGLMVTATCIDCHTAHRELPASNVASTVNKHNIAGTCAKCHLGIYEVFRTSIHSAAVSDGTDGKKLPVCNDCHLSHTIKRVDVDEFRQGILDQCGKCHHEVAESYFDTFHGKVSKLGSTRTAKCYDCHGAHNVLPISNPNSTLYRANIVETCKTCHENSNRKFVGYLTHATHYNKARYPYLYYTFWGMSFLLIGTFGFFGLHTVLWLPRAIHERRKNGRSNNKKTKGGDESAVTEARPLVADRLKEKKTYVQRFDPFSRFLHLLVILSFLSLAITGMTIKFSGVGVFQHLSGILGGYEVTGFIHRIAAFITFLYFFLHIGYLIFKKRKEKTPLKQMFTGEYTIVPRKRDFIEFWQTVKWFLGIGRRPEYGRWTYWEKFDYFAVFWGVAIIGSSGLMLWFPEFFTKLGLPGWLINVATIIHSDEALLATGFIFTVHFFNTHFRPDKFPMDPVIFTGSVELEELKEDRPREYSLLIKTRNIRKKLVAPPPKWFQTGAKIFGLTCLAIGILVIILVIYAMIFLYQ